MPAQPTDITPIVFTSGMEVIDEKEGETIQELTDTLLKISTRTFEDSGHALRSVHAKAHGIVKGELQVLEDLPPVYAQGMFQPGKRYEAVMRLSTPPGDMLPDDVSTPRGIALKLIGVDGARLPGSEGDVTQDFIMVNGPAFLAPDAKHFLTNLKMLAATTDRAEGAKQALSTLLRGTERLLEKLGTESGTLKAMGGHPMTHFLGETFHTQAALLYGPYIAKLSLMPHSAALTALKDAPLDLKAHPNGIRDAVKAFFAGQGGEWLLCAQLCVDIEKMPVEDASVPWPETLSSQVPIARLVIPAQDAWSDASSAALDDGLSFSPWHGIADHRPLGSVMRARRLTYEASAGFRGQHNGCPMHQPRPAVT